MKKETKFWLYLFLLAVLTPVGLMVPAYFRAGGAWGEWGSDELGNLVGYVPKGLARLSSLWNAPIPDYAFGLWESKPLLHQGLAYIISAVIGIIAVSLLMVVIGKFLSRKR